MLHNKPSHKKAWYIVFLSALLGCSLSAAFPQFSMTVTDVSLNTGLSENFLLTSDTVKSAAIVLSMLISGFVYKKIGARKTFALSLAFSVIPQFTLPFITSPSIFIFLKIIQGSSSLVFPVLLIIIMDAIPDRQAGLATAIFNGIFYSGGGIGGTIAGFFIANYGWLSSFYAIGIIELALGLIWLFTVKDTSEKNNAKDENATKIENSSSLTLLKTPMVWLLIIAFISTTFVIQAITVDMPLFSTSLGYNETETGTINTAVTIGLLSACLISGRISDFVAAKSKNKAKARIIVLAIGPILVTISSLMLIFLDLSYFKLFYLTALLFSFGGSWGLGTFYSILPELFNEEKLPIVTGLAGGAGDLGMPIAPLLVGVIFGAQGLWHLGWAVCIIIAGMSLLSCLILLSSKKLALSR